MDKNIAKKLNNDIEKRAEADLLKLRELERLADLDEYRKQAAKQFFEDGSCTGGNTKE